ncbi:MAG TPA: response regulator transcription factor [Actinomycetota bacterium]|nr:response regulator transcription factor [Actinomycetota bacterium]
MTLEAVRSALTEVISVLIVDDHGLVRDGLRALLLHEGIEVVGEAGSATDALRLAADLAPDVVVLDIRLPDRDGVSIIGELRVVAPASRVLLCSGSPDGSTLFEVARSDSDGFVAKEAPNDEIVSAIRSVAAGSTVVGPRSAGLMYRGLQGHAPEVERMERLSGREREVLGLLGRGMTNREIGRELSISEKTARNHVSRILRKLSLRHRTEAAVFALPMERHLVGSTSADPIRG